jgi:YD repeat-containing protein
MFVSTLLAPGPCGVGQAQYEPGPLETPPASPCREGRSCGGRGDAGVADSVYFFNGEFYQSATDMRIRGRGPDFIWARKYRSRNGPTTAMGAGWDYSYNIYIEAAGADRILHDGNTRVDLYTLQANGKWGRNEFFRELEQNVDNTYSLIFADTGKWIFRPLADLVAPGRISRVVDRNNNMISFTYDAQGRLSTITDTLSRNITVGYDVNNRITAVTDFTGRQVVYTYDANGDLRSVRSPVVTGTPNSNDFPAGKTTSYTYSSGFADPRLNHNLLSIIDPKGQMYLVNSYASTLDPADLNFDRVVRQVWGNPGDIIDVTYVAQTACVGNNSAAINAIVNDRVGNVKEYFYDAGNRLAMAREFTGRADPDQPTTESANRPTNKLRPSDPNYFETRWAHNTDSMPTLVTYPNLNSTANTYELDLNPLAARRERGNLRQVTRSAGPLGGDQPSITESYTYETGFGGCGCGTNFVKTHTDGRGNVTMHTYDAFGNRTHTDHRPGGGVEDWTYNAFGQTLTHTLPANGSGHRRLDTYSYYAAGAQMGYLQNEVVDSGGFGLTTTFEYDNIGGFSRGNVIRQVHPNGADSLWIINDLDQAIIKYSRETLSGSGIRYETKTWFDSNDNVIRTDLENRDENGLILPNSHWTILYTREQLNQVTQSCQERGDVFLTDFDLTCAAFPPGMAVITEYGYDANRNRTLLRSPMAVSGSQPDNVVEMLYDERDLLFRSIRAPGSIDQSTDQTDYDGNGNGKTESRGLESAPRVTQSSYDGYNRQTSMTDPMGNVSTNHYDANGNRTSERLDGELLDVPGGAGNLRLAETTSQYDAMDRRFRQDVAHFDTQPPQSLIGDGLSTTLWTYADNSQVTSRIDDNPGHVTTYTFDTANRPLTTTDAKGNTVTNTYDADSNVIQTVEADKSDLGNPTEFFTTTFTYDPLDRPTSTTDNVGNSWQYFYDSRNNRARIIDARGNHIRTEYDGLNRLTLTSRDMDGNQVFTDPDDIITTQTWDDSSRLTSRTDDNGNTTANTYDALDRRVGTDYADCTTDSTTYDVHDNPTLLMDAVGNVVLCSYDLLDRLASKSITPGPGASADTTSELYLYDGRSRLIRAQDNDSLVTRGSAGASGYDSLSNVLRETQQITAPATPPRTVVAQYDGESNQTRLTHPPPGVRVILRTYDVLDRPLVVSDNPVPIIASYSYIGRLRLERRDYGNGTRYEPSYDGVRRMTRSFHSVIVGGAPIDDRLYGWDPMHNKLFADNALAAPPPDLKNYLYDADNRLMQSGHHTFGNPPCITDYQFDGVGNRTQVQGCDSPGPYTLDPTLCEPADFQMNQYTTTPLDARNYDMNGNLADRNSGTTAIYTYDYRNRLVEFFDAPIGVVTTYKFDCLGRRIQKNVGGIITRFYYDGSELIEEQTVANTVAATYVYSKGPHSRLQMVRGGQKYFYHEDDLGSTVKETDINGNVVSHAEYLDYGALDTSVSIQPPDQAQSFRSDLSPLVPGPQAIADDFTLAATETITRLRWWGAYTPGFAAHVHDFHITIFDDNFGAPDNPVFQETAGNNVVLTATGQFVGGEPELRCDYTLTNAFQAQAGVTYWLSIENTLAQPGAATPWKWESSATGNGVSYWSFNQFGPWNQQPADLAFELYADPPGIGNPFLYRGFFFDPESGLYWGDFDPLTGRYIERDQNPSGSEGPGPWLVRATGGSDLTTIIVTFDEPITPNIEIPDVLSPLDAFSNPYSFSANNPTSWSGFATSGVFDLPGWQPPWMTTSSQFKVPPFIPKQDKKGCSGDCSGTSWGSHVLHVGKCTGKEEAGDVQRGKDSACENAESRAQGKGNEICQKAGGDDCFCNIKQHKVDKKKAYCETWKLQTHEEDPFTGETKARDPAKILKDIREVYPDYPGFGMVAHVACVCWCRDDYKGDCEKK